MKRTVVVTLASYVDVEGRRRRGQRGDQIDVHPDHVGRFDAAQAVAVGDAVPTPVVDTDNDDAAKPEPVKVKATRRAAKADG